VYLDRRASNSYLFDQQTHELLTLFEIKMINAVANTFGEGVDLTRESVVGCQFLMLGQERFALSFELLMTTDDLLMPRLKVAQVNSLHLVEVCDSAPLSLGLLQSTVQAFELSVQHFIIGDRCASRQCRLSPYQDHRPKESLSDLLPHQGVQLFSPSGGLRASPIGSAGFE
jgi:hypothetical protein